MAKYILILLPLFFLSCSDVHDGVSVLEGNYAYQRGEYQSATLHYLQVLQKDRFTPWVQYNLGNVYNALGESNTALAAWNSISNKAPEEVLFRVYFNKGLLQFQKGLYQESYVSYQKALLLNHNNLDAKKNLELSLLKMQSLGADSSDRSLGFIKSGAPNTESKALLDYIQRLEGNQWKSNRQNASGNSNSSDW